jgi:catechol-2,3-dioxygenase
MIGRIGAVVLDAADIGGLARFYAAMLGAEITEEDQNWVTISEPGGGPVVLSFQHAPDHQPPRWPDPAHPQQYHLDIAITGDIDSAEKEVLALGATKLLDGDGKFRVYADPAGHPFCLCWDWTPGA